MSPCAKQKTTAPRRWWLVSRPAHSNTLADESLRFSPLNIPQPRHCVRRRRGTYCRLGRWSRPESGLVGSASTLHSFGASVTATTICKLEERCTYQSAGTASSIAFGMMFVATIPGRTVLIEMFSFCIYYQQQEIVHGFLDAYKFEDGSNASNKVKNLLDISCSTKLLPPGEQNLLQLWHRSTLGKKDAGTVRRRSQ